MSDDLKKQAEELGIEVDGRWGDERLEQEINKKLSEEKPAKSSKAEKLIAVRINRDFWDAEGVRHRKGTVIELAVEEAMDGVETGAVSRVK